MLGISDGLRGELEAIGAPVGVSVVMPGMIKTGMNPIGSIAAEQVAANVLDAIRRDRPYVFTDDHSIHGSGRAPLRDHGVARRRGVVNRGSWVRRGSRRY